MTEKEQLAQLQQQMDGLIQKQALLHGDILRLRRELASFQAQPSVGDSKLAHELPATPPAPPIQPPLIVSNPANQPPKAGPAAPFDWEQYIGGNLINKIGITILLLGLGLFVKYAIDRGLFPPVVRVASGYLAGLALVATAYFLRKKYEAYSAVLFSGGMATLYFTSYIGATFFNPPIIGLYFAFWLMGLLTATTIIVASRYEREIIGLLGLVGAYAVPFLVNTGSENFTLFFSYVTLVNVGVLVLAARRDWHAMTYTACLLTWLILVVSLVGKYDELHNSPIGWVFSMLTMGLFYAAILAWHWRRQTVLGVGAYIVLGAQALVFYGIIMMLNDGGFGTAYYGLATLLCATPHFLAAYAVQGRFKDHQPFIVFATIGVFFVTISIPIEFVDNAKAMTLLWMVEVLALFFAARKLPTLVFEVSAYLILFALAAVLQVHWMLAYYVDVRKPFPVLWNLEFGTNMLLLAGMVGLYFLHRRFPLPNKSPILDAVLRCLPAAMLYLGFFHEIHHAFELEAANPSGFFGQKSAVLTFKLLFLFLYTFGALAVAAELNIRRWKSVKLDWFLVWAGLLGIVLFLATQLEAMNQLRQIYLTDKVHSTPIFLLIRFLGFGIMGWLYYHVHNILQRLEALQSYRPLLPILLYLLLLVFFSSELVTVMLLFLDNPDSQLPYREGFSILWGLYAILLIALGFKDKSQPLRVAGMVLFGITLVKIFFFDLGRLPILSRTGLFLALGLLLLGASYLYQRRVER